MTDKENQKSKQPEQIKPGKTIAELLHRPEAAEIDFTVKREKGGFRPVKLEE